MLVLARRKGEAIYIGNDIYVTINDLDAHRVRLGIEAPGHVQIMREELLEPADAAARLQAAKGGK